MSLILKALILIGSVQFSVGNTIPNNDSLIVEMPPGCRGEKICFEKSKDYPTDKINSLLNSTGWGIADAIRVVGHRQGSFVEICKSKILPPTQVYEIEDENGIIRFVVQDEKFKQIVNVIKCSDEGNITRSSDIYERSYFAYGALISYSLTCRQVTIDFKFLVLSIDGQSLDTASVSGGLPVCCSCNVERKNINNFSESCSNQTIESNHT
ncbi:uncharacterized protein LOC114245226 [Bombyx mandarina]|uniref:Uncharacterized protein LOC114245226 n=1 Tax=Bombyx mandarina TaxID=7092 RepID=A0A6J2JW52_BOMMA|nr:uncharacterized protein LOC114245226 [Bombyx mandarina]